jgi:hypothetical protein
VQFAAVLRMHQSELPLVSLQPLAPAPIALLRIGVADDPHHAAVRLGHQTRRTRCVRPVPSQRTHALLQCRMAIEQLQEFGCLVNGAIACHFLFFLQLVAALSSGN